MNIVNKKPQETPPNIFYGVDVNDKKAVKKELHRRQFRRFIGNIVFLVVFAIVCVFAYDTIRVTFFEKHPMFYIKENVDGGVLYKGIGYSRLYCDDGHVYNYLNKQNKCVDNSRSFSQVFYSAFKVYAINNKIIDDKNIKSMKISNMVVDGNSSYGGSNYLIDFTFTCLDDTSNCFKKLKKQDDEFNYKLYVCMDNNNVVQNITAFVPYGNFYNELVNDYSDKVKQYLIDTSHIDEELLDIFEIHLEANYGKVKYKGTYYKDSYLIKVNFTCSDSSYTCIDFKEYSYDKNLVFEAGMLVDDEDNILIVNKAVFGD